MLFPMNSRSRSLMSGSRKFHAARRGSPQCGKILFPFLHAQFIRMISARISARGPVSRTIRSSEQPYGSSRCGAPSGRAVGPWFDGDIGKETVRRGGTKYGDGCFPSRDPATPRRRESALSPGRHTESSGGEPHAGVATQEKPSGRSSAPQSFRRQASGSP